MEPNLGLGETVPALRKHLKHSLEPIHQRRRRAARRNPLEVEASDHLGSRDVQALSRLKRLEADPLGAIEIT